MNSTKRNGMRVAEAIRCLEADVEAGEWNVERHLAALVADDKPKEIDRVFNAGRAAHFRGDTETARKVYACTIRRALRRSVIDRLGKRRCVELDLVKIIGWFRRRNLMSGACFAKLRDTFSGREWHRGLELETLAQLTQEIAVGSIFLDEQGSASGCTYTRSQQVLSLPATSATSRSACEPTLFP